MKRREYIKPDSRVVGSFKPILLSDSPTPDERRKPEEEDNGLNIFDEGSDYWENPNNAL